MKHAAVVLVAVIVVALLGFVLFGKKIQNKLATYTNPAGNSASNGIFTNTTPKPATVTPQNSNDSSIDKDLNSLDSQLKAVDQNSLSVDQGLSDTPVPQAQF